MEILNDLTLRAFFISNANSKKRFYVKVNRNLTVNERIDFSNKYMYKYNNDSMIILTLI